MHDMMIRTLRRASARALRGVSLRAGGRGATRRHRVSRRPQGAGSAELRELDARQSDPLAGDRQWRGGRLDVATRRLRDFHRNAVGRAVGQQYVDRLARHIDRRDPAEPAAGDVRRRRAELRPARALSGTGRRRPIHCGHGGLGEHEPAHGPGEDRRCDGRPYPRDGLLRVASHAGHGRRQRHGHVQERADEAHGGAPARAERALREGGRQDGSGQLDHSRHRAGEPDVG